MHYYTITFSSTIPSGVPASSMPGASPSVNGQSGKSAASLAIERAVVDKGEKSQYSETKHADGKVWSSSIIL